MYTDTEEVPLKDVLLSMKKKENGAAVALDVKDVYKRQDVHEPFVEEDVVWIVGENVDVYKLVGENDENVDL